MGDLLLSRRFLLKLVGQRIEREGRLSLFKRLANAVRAVKAAVALHAMCGFRPRVGVAAYRHEG